MAKKMAKASPPAGRGKKRRRKKLKVFLSWSGKRSHLMANALKEWLPKVLPFAEPWLSSRDIEAGTRSMEALQKELNIADAGIVCVTRGLKSSWVDHEVGALAKSRKKKSRIIAFVLDSDFDFEELSAPLRQFQAKRANEQDVIDIIHSFRRAHGGAAAKVKKEKKCKFWPELEKKLAMIPATDSEKTPQRDLSPDIGKKSGIIPC